MTPTPYPADVIPALFARYVNRRTGQAMTTVQEYRYGCRHVHSVRLADANGYEWIGSVEDFYETWVHEDIYTRNADAGAAG